VGSGAGVDTMVKTKIPSSRRELNPRTPIEYSSDIQIITFKVNQCTQDETSETKT